MLPPFRAFVGGPIGSGGQWMSWIHRDDVTSLVLDALANDAYRGPVNATAPQPVTNRDFASMLGRALARPAWLPTPAFALRLALGEMAELLLTGQRVLPGVANRLTPASYASGAAHPAAGVAGSRARTAQRPAGRAGRRPGYPAA